MKLTTLVGSVLSLGIVCCTSFGADNSKIRVPLENTGVIPSGEGTVSVKLDRGNSQLKVKVKGLTPNASCDVLVDGINEGSLPTDNRGRGRSVFRAKGKGQRLDFDPRGLNLEIAQSGTTILNAIVSGTGEPEGVLCQEKTKLARVAATQGRASAKFKETPNGKKRFKVELEGVVPGTYSVAVAGLVKGTLVASGDESELVFAFPASDDPEHQLLDFDPRGQVIDVLLGGVVQFSGVMEAQVPKINVCVESERSQIIPKVSGITGTAEAKFETDQDCENSFRVELVGVPDGAYDFLVSGSLRGSIDVNSGEGELKFDAEADDSDELPLTFDPVGALLEVREGATVHFSGTFNPPAPTCTPAGVEGDLTSTGADPDGSGEYSVETGADCEQEFEVKVKDVAVGSYELHVGGVLRGLIDVVTTSEGTKGKIEFSNETHSQSNGNELPLTFDPTGLDVQVILGGTTYFTGTIGSGTGGACGHQELELPLLNLGVDADAHGEVEFEQDEDCDQNFDVEIEDLPAGNFDLFVGGVLRGVIVVAQDGDDFKGKLEFDNNPDEPGEVLLDFDPRGQLIEVKQGATVFLSRTLE